MEVTSPSTPQEFWLDMDLVILQHAWGVLLIPGWEDSRGAVAEAAFAEKHGLSVYTHQRYDELLEDWHGYS